MDIDMSGVEAHAHDPDKAVLFHPPARVAAGAHIDWATYTAMYERSISDPAGFWAEQARKHVTWFRDFSTV